ncbi:hypothetical protein FRB93_003259 [Tulasnella sp. JGI-2019a]|nr:hypothetical protein FRB93_003259 [Tulasnella sp. JGI-2019a]
MDSSQSALSHARTLTSQAGLVDTSPDVDRLFEQARRSVRSGYEALHSKKAEKAFFDDMDVARMRDNLESLSRMLNDSPLPYPTKLFAAAIPGIAFDFFLDSRTVRWRGRELRDLARNFGEMTIASLRPLQNVGDRSDSATGRVVTTLEELYM